MYTKLVPIFIILLGLILDSISDQPMNKIRFCGAALNQSYEVYDTTCRRGLWMPEPVPADCICVTGTWLLMENYCDSNFYIISGPPPSESAGTGTHYSCFKFSDKFRRFISLTGETNSYKQYIIQNNGKNIESLDKPDTPYSPSGELPVVLVRLNANTEIFIMHKAGVHSDIWQKCLGLRKPKSYHHVIKSDESISLLKSTFGDETCDDLKDTDFPYTMSNKTEWIIENPGSFGWSTNQGIIPVSDCSCKPPPQVSTVVVTTNTVRGGESLSVLRNTDHDYDSVPGDAFSLYPKKRDPLLHAEHLKDNARTTASILSKFKDTLFSRVQPPPFPNPLFEYIRQGKYIINKFCPEIPSSVIRSLVGIFRLLLTEVLRKHPESFSLNVDAAVHKRILQSLKTCYSGISKPVKFIWKSVAVTKDSKQCNKPAIVSAEIDGKPIPISLTNLPRDVRFIDGDVMLEVAWKILLVAHYTCTQNFEENPEDLSLMFTKAQDFLTIPNVMFRWENPSYGLTAAYKILAPKLNVFELGQQIDACLLVAFEKSSFRIWMSRPESANEFIPESVVQRSMDKLTGNERVSTTIQGRTGFKSNTYFNVLGNTGFCVNGFNDPVEMSSAEGHMAETIGITGC